MAGGNSGMIWSGRSKSRSKRASSRFSCFWISSIRYLGNRALSENLTKQPLLRNFLHPLNREELDVGHRNPLGLQQQIPQVLIAPAAVNQHTNVPVHRFHHSEAYLRAAVVHSTFEVFEQHVGQLLKRRPPLPFQSVHPPPQIIQHGPWIFVVP